MICIVHLKYYNLQDKFTNYMFYSFIKSIRIKFLLINFIYISLCYNCVTSSGFLVHASKNSYNFHSDLIRISFFLSIHLKFKQTSILLIQSLIYTHSNNQFHIRAIPCQIDHLWHSISRTFDQTGICYSPREFRDSLNQHFPCFEFV